MNEFVAKKVGEVIAFSVVGQEILEKGHCLAPVLGSVTIADCKQQLARQHQAFLKLIQMEHVELATSKAEDTALKLRRLGETYIGDQWSNSVEIMEWLGFFEGAAIVHCAVVHGAATKLENTDLAALAQQSQQLHRNMLAAVTTALDKAGAERA